MDMSLNKSRYLEDQKIAEYYSDSKDKYINVDDMSETHCRRVIKKLIREQGMRVDYLVDYHTRLRMMIEKVTTEKNLKDIFDIVDEAQKRLRREDEERKIRN